jgi:HK97 family phage prohead protease
MNTEIRALRSIEQRALTEDEKGAGYIGALRGTIPYNKDSHRLSKRGRNKQFIERIAPNAFARSMDDGEVMVMAGHTDDPLMGLARNKRNLTITSDDSAMTWEALLPDTRAGRDLLRLVELGIINGTSFEFDVDGPDGEEWDQRDARTDGRLIKRAILRALNPVTWPAYADSSLMVEMRKKDGRVEFEQPAQPEPEIVAAYDAANDISKTDMERRLRILNLCSVSVH